MIQLHGLSPIEVELADRLWALDTKEEVQKFIANLPTRRLRGMAIGLYHLMLIESMDEAMDLEDLSLANAVIDSVK
jgi:hypothetical protein